MVLCALGVGVSLGLGWRFVWWFVLAGCCGILFVEFGCWICVLFWDVLMVLVVICVECLVGFV